MELKVIVALVIAVNFCDYAISVEVANAFIESGVVPDVVNVAPQDEVKITYPSGVSVDFGNDLTPTQVKDAPNVEWTADDGQFYTLLMVDPDAPSRAKPRFRSWKHWVVINIPGANVAKGRIIARYLRPAPPKKTGSHRYVFLVYKQANGKIRNFKKNAGKRSSWSAVKFAKRFKLGNPIAGNFFQAQYN